MEENILFNVCAIIFSGIAGVILTIIVQRKLIKYDLKYAVLINFVENRYDIRGENFTKAINRIYLDYAKDIDVINAVQEFHRAISNKSVSSDLANSKLYEIYSKMCKNLKIEPMGETLFLMPFNIKN